MLRLLRRISSIVALTALAAFSAGPVCAVPPESLLVHKPIIVGTQASTIKNHELANIFYRSGTRFELPDTGFAFQFNTHLQARYLHSSGGGAGDTSSFEFKRLRLMLSGSALYNEFTYFLQTDFVGGSASDRSRSPEVRDAYLQWNPLKELGVRAGQYRVFLSRQENSSSSKLQFVDASVASDTFQLGRQQGASVRYTGMEGRLFAAGGISNGESSGEGRNRAGVDTCHTGAATVRYTALGTIDAFEEGDVNYTEDAALNFGAAYAFGQASEEDSGQEASEKFDKHSISADANFKMQGFSMHGEFFWRLIDPDQGGNESDVEPLGFYAQAGYFFVPKKFEVAARYAFVDCDDGAYREGLCSGNDEVNQVTAGLNYYFWKHALKAQLNWEYTEGNASGDDGDDTETDRIVFQLSSYF